ncbi:MAG TPA: amino acid ABC transporter permease [Aestuariivirgaceae bacterium]|jgi:His/Glu/Gln/Arg/opine family amino acid ABC transporter permease subunit|nr:amino acid ABC transporter permease [Aestuariivirgaceae bacterium]
MELFNLDVVAQYGPALLRGLSVTVFLTTVVILAALVLAIPVALIRMSPNVVLRGFGSFYVEVIRGTPLLLQLVYIYYVLPSLGVNLDPMLAAIVGLTLNYTAYMSEVYRGGILAVPKSQWEAAATVGMTKARAFHRIVLPQALRIVTPALGNYFISLFKDTALASVVTVQELTFTGQIISARSYQYFTIYTVTGILYLAVGYPAALFVRWLEKRTSQAYRPKRTT